MNEIEQIRRHYELRRSLNQKRQRAALLGTCAKCVVVSVPLAFLVVYLALKKS